MIKLTYIIIVHQLFIFEKIRENEIYISELQDSIDILNNKVNEFRKTFEWYLHLDKLFPLLREIKQCKEKIKELEIKNNILSSQLLNLKIMLKK